MANKQTPAATNIAAVDIPAPGTTPNQGTFAFRAGDEIPVAWLEQQADYLKTMEEELGGGANTVVRRAPLSEAQNIAAETRGAGSPQP